MAGTTRRLLAILLASTSLAAGGAGDPRLGQQKAAACIACHGPDGNSLADVWPKLAGQLPEYLGKQLRDFKAGRRKDEQMSPQAASLAEVDIPDVAAYFAARQVKPGESDKALLARGEDIFRKGRGRPNVVPACIGCHGLSGEGNRNWNKTQSRVPPVLAPAIGGQHAAYVAKQIRAYRDGGRTNDAGRVMRDIASRLDDQEIAAVAAYAATLTR